MDVHIVLFIGILMFVLGVAIGLIAPVVAANIYQSISLMFEEEDEKEENAKEGKECSGS
jgi:predicted cation transporter